MIAGAENRRHKIIMAVDDSPETLLLLRGLIEGHGYTFLGAARGLECLTLVQRMIPRIIFLDIQMPGVDGYEVCRRLRTNRALQQVPIIFLTAEKTPEAVRAGVSAGGNDFLVKPFAPQKLLERLDHWAARRLSV